MSKWMSKLEDDLGILASNMPKPSANVIDFASPSLNYCVGNGGLIEGKAVCFFGPESGGKSLLMMLAIISVQRKYLDGISILFDAEFSFNVEWFIKLGGDPKRLIVRQTNDPLMIFDYMEKEVLEMLQEGMPLKAIAIDSVKSIRYPGDYKSKTTDITMGGSGAKYLGPALKGLLPIIRKYSITTLLVQQVYEELDQYKAMRNPYKLPDGRALKHFCDYMLQVDKLDTKSGAVERGKNMVGTGSQIGHKVRIKGKKNRCGAPFRTAEFTLEYGKGIVDTTTELVNLAMSLGIIFHPVGPNGNPNAQMWQFYTYDKIRGEGGMVEWVKANPDIQKEIYKAVMSVDTETDRIRNEILERDQKSADIDLDIEEDIS